MLRQARCGDSTAGGIAARASVSGGDSSMARAASRRAYVRPRSSRPQTRNPPPARGWRTRDSGASGQETPARTRAAATAGDPAARPMTMAGSAPGAAVIAGDSPRARRTRVSSSRARRAAGGSPVSTRRFTVSSGGRQTGASRWLWIGAWWSGRTGVLIRQIEQSRAIVQIDAGSHTSSLEGLQANAPRSLRLVEVADRGLELVPAVGTAEPDDLAVILGQRVCLHRLARPRAGLVDAIGDVESGQCVSHGSWSRSSTLPRLPSAGQLLLHGLVAQTR